MRIRKALLIIVTLCLFVGAIYAFWFFTYYIWWNPVDVKILTDKRKYRYGEPVHIEIEIINIWKKPIYVGSLPYIKSPTPVRVIAPNGRMCPTEALSLPYGAKVAKVFPSSLRYLKPRKKIKISYNLAFLGRENQIKYPLLVVGEPLFIGKGFLFGRYYVKAEFAFIKHTNRGYGYTLAGPRFLLPEGVHRSFFLPKEAGVYPVQKKVESNIATFEIIPSEAKKKQDKL